MTKEYCFSIDEFQIKWIFHPVRNRVDIIKLLMKSIKVMLVNTPPAPEKVCGKIVLKVSKMSRIIFEGPNKIFSIYFPFSVKEEAEGLLFYSKEYSSIDSKATSEILEIIDSPNLFSCTDIFEFAEPIHDVSIYNMHIWSLMRELILMEDGYLRFDHDPLNVNGHIHPLNHLDIFYTNGTTFKLGTKENPKLAHLIDILDLSTNSHYLSVSNN